MLTAAKTAETVSWRICGVQGLANSQQLGGEDTVCRSLVTLYSVGLFIGCHCGLFIVVSVIGWLSSKGRTLIGWLVKAGHTARWVADDPNQFQAVLNAAFCCGLRRSFLGMWEFICIFPFSVTRNKVGIVVSLSSSGSLCALIQPVSSWRERKAVTGAPSLPRQGGVRLQRAALQLQGTGEGFWIRDFPTFKNNATTSLIRKLRCDITVT